MSEYISRESVKDIVRSGISTDTEADKEYVYGLIDSIPSADVRPNIHGHWGRRIVDNGFNADWVCSECGHREYTDFIHMNFCPNCGADMRGET